MEIIEGTTPEDRRALFGLGYEPVPILGKAPLWDGWNTGDITAKRLREVEAAHPDHKSTGIRTGRLVVVDVDLWNPEHAETVSETVQAVLGLSVLERVGEKGVGLFFFNRRPIPKITVAGHPPEAKPGDKPHKVEFLGTGQQVAAFGIHPRTGKPYTWSGGSLLDHEIDKLPEVTGAMICEAVHAVRATLAELGYTGLAVTGDGSRGDSASHSGKGEPVTADILGAMLSHIDPACDRLTWIGIGGAIKSARVIDRVTGDEDSDFDSAELFDRWSSGELNPEHKPGNYAGRPDCDKNFDGLTAGREGGSGVGTIIEMSRAEGYSGEIRVPAIERLRGVKPNGAAPPVASTVEVPEEIPDDTPEPPANRWAALIRLGSDPSKIKPPVPIIPGYLLSRGVTALVAPRRSGKTIIALDVALSVASAMPWSGEPIIGEWHSVYLCGEDAENTAAHVRVWCEEHCGGQLPERFHFIPDVPNLLALENRDVAGLVEAVRAMVPEGARVLWIVDTWQRATTDGGQNDDADMKPAFRSLEGLANSFHGAAIGCFHPPKDNARTISGVAFQENAAAAMWFVEKTDSDAATSERKMTVGNMKGRGEGNFKLFRFEESTVETVKVERADGDPFELEVTGVRAHHTGGTGEDKETAIERVRKDQVKDQDARDIVFEVVKALLVSGKRVLNQNNRASSAVQLAALVAVLEGDHGLKLGGSDRAKRKTVRRHLDTLTGNTDGRLGYQETDKAKHIKATYVLTGKDE